MRKNKRSRSRLGRHFRTFLVFLSSSPRLDALVRWNAGKNYLWKSGRLRAFAAMVGLQYTDLTLKITVMWSDRQVAMVNLRRVRAKRFNSVSLVLLAAVENRFHISDVFTTKVLGYSSVNYGIHTGVQISCNISHP